MLWPRVDQRDGFEHAIAVSERAIRTKNDVCPIAIDQGQIRRDVCQAWPQRRSRGVDIESEFTKRQSGVSAAKPEGI